MHPRVLREFFERYRRAKFPNDTIANNVLKTMGLPADRAQTALDIVKANAIVCRHSVRITRWGH